MINLLLATAFACSDLGGGYMTQKFKLDIQENVVNLEIERWSPFANTDGLEVWDQTVKSLKVAFPTVNCLFKVADSPQVTLFHCATGITPIIAEFSRVDGSTGRLDLPNNFAIEGYRTSKKTVSEWGDQELYLAKVDTRSGSGGVGFNLTSCRN